MFLISDSVPMISDVLEQLSVRYYVVGATVLAVLAVLEFAKNQRGMILIVDVGFDSAKTYTTRRCHGPVTGISPAPPPPG